MTFSRHSISTANRGPGSAVSAFFWVVGLLLICCTLARAVEMENVRLRAGLDVFRSVLAADMNIMDKRDDDGVLLLVLIYRNNKKFAKDIARHLEDAQRIHGIPIRVKITTSASLSLYQDPPPAGIFLVQEVHDDLETIVSFGNNHQIIVFSPFEGDVEAGVLGGIHISDRLLPYINIEAMRAAGIRIKPFFLRVSKQYGE